MFPWKSLNLLKGFALRIECDPYRFMFPIESLLPFWLMVLWSFHVRVHVVDWCARLQPIPISSQYLFRHVRVLMKRSVTKKLPSVEDVAVTASLAATRNLFRIRRVSFIGPHPTNAVLVQELKMIMLHHQASS